MLRTNKPADGLGSLTTVDHAVIDYLAEVRPAVALLLEGAWGSGKTHFLNTRGPRLAKRCDKRLISFSVAGLKTREELEQALFLAASPFFKSGLIGALGVFARAGLRWIKVEPKDIKPNAELVAGKVAISIDDAERFAGGYKVLFGFVIDLVDQNGVHVILAASEERSVRVSVEYGAWKEKIVGRTIRLAPEPDFIVNTVLSELSDRGVAERLHRCAPSITQTVRVWGMGNMRAAKHAIRDVSRIVAALGPQLDDLDHGVEVLVCGVLAGSLEIKRDAKRMGEIAKLFSHADLGMAYQVELLSADDGESSVGSIAKQFFGRYEETPLAKFPGDKAFERFLREGTIDSEAVLAALRRVSAPASRRDAFLSEYRSMPQEDFDNELRSVVDDLQRCSVTSLGLIAKMYVTLDYLAQLRLIGRTEDEVKDLCVASVSELDPMQVTDPDGDDDLYWYLQRIEDGHREVQAAVVAKRAKAREMATATRRQHLISSFSPDLAQVGQELQEWKSTPLFVGDPKEIANAVMALTPLQHQELLRFLGSRRHIPGYEVKLGVEKNILVQVASLLSQSVPVGNKLSIAQSQLRLVAVAMQALSELLVAPDVAA